MFEDFCIVKSGFAVRLARSLTVQYLSSTAQIVVVCIYEKRTVNCN